MPDQQTSQQALLVHELMAQRPEWFLGAVDTKDASEITGIPAATLCTLRSVGGGPRYFCPTPRTVRYLRLDLFEWMLAGGLKSNTADAGTRIDLRAMLSKLGGADD